MCVCVCVHTHTITLYIYALVGHCLATKVCIGRLLATRGPRSEDDHGVGQ